VSRTVPFKQQLKSDPSGTTILAVIDASDAVAESDETNNEARQAVP